MTESLPRATHAGQLHIGDVSIPCYVLENGTRIITQSGIQRAIGMSTGRGKGERAHRLAHFAGQIDGKATPFKDLAVRINSPLLFRTPTGGKPAYGYEATALADMCDATLGARQLGLLQKQQLHLAEKAELLLRGFARVGIIALVDEATGYQDIRDRDELHRILEKYISPELLPWAKRFPEDFYRELFRLRRWTYPRESAKRPGYVGTLTNLLVYEKLPPGVLDELRSLNPTVKPGRRRHRHHQFLTEDIGNPHLERHLVAVTTLLRVATSWSGFLSMFTRAFPTPGTQLSLNFDESEG